MQIARFNQIEYSSAYGILCSSIPKQNDREGLYPTFCRIPVGGKTSAHSHFETELFYIISGNGLMRLASKATRVEAHDLIRIPAFEHHELENIGTEELTFLSVYSEDFKVPFLPSSVVITAAPPTPNGPLHLGHISGPYLASDVLRRYLKQRSINVLSHSGSDDHQNYVAEKAHSVGQTTKQYRDQMLLRIQSGFKVIGIDFDEFVEPSADLQYQKRIQDFTKRAIDAKIIELEKIKFPFCLKCNHFLVDALINGRCPDCNEHSRGCCESCGLVVPPYELLEIKCSRCKGAAVKEPISVFIFSLSKYLPLIQKDLQSLQLSARLREFVQRIISRKNLKVLVSHPGSTSGRIHVWFEMAAHYERFALSKDEWVHCFGFDNSFYYLLFIPALLKALSPESKLPDVVITNEFLLLEGEKFSTSRNHAIWADEFNWNTDHLRLFLSLNRPSTSSSNFRMERFKDFSSDLGEQLQQIQSRAKKLSVITRRACSEAEMECHRFLRQIELFMSPKSFDLRRASRCILEFMDRTIQVKDDGEKLRIQTLATAMAPIMPKEAEKILDEIS